MINWSTDEKKFKKENPKEYKLWRLTQLINYGLDGEKLDKNEIKHAWPKIKNRLDPDSRKVVEFFVWGQKWHGEPGLMPDRSNFWQWYFKNPTS
jgi:hypothetical protein